MSEIEHFIKMIIADANKGKRIYSCLKTTYEEIDRVLIIYQIKRTTRLVPKKEKPEAAKSLAADWTRDHIGPELQSATAEKPLHKFCNIFPEIVAEQMRAVINDLFASIYRRLNAFFFQLHGSVCLVTDTNEEKNFLGFFFS